MSKDFKIVFAGTPGAGKTTAIAVLSDRAPVSTEVKTTDASIGKEMTTVGMDFGQVDVGDGHYVRLFGTPGQERFDFMWKIIATDAQGLVVLVDNSRPDPLKDFSSYLDAYKDLLPNMNCVAGIGRTDECSTPSIDAYADLMAERGLTFPVLPVDVRQRDDVLMLVEAVLAQAEARC